MVNNYPEVGQSHGSLITLAQEIVDEAFSIDPIFMEECAIRVFGSAA